MFEWLGLSALKSFGAWVMNIDVSSIAKSVADGYAAKASAQANTQIAAVGANRDVAIVDSQTHAQIVVANIQSDLRRGELQAAANAADRFDWKTSWIRPLFCAQAALYVGAWVLYSVGITDLRPRDLPDVILYLLSGIVCTIFVMRPFEKNNKADAVAAIAAARSVPAKTK